MAQRTLHHRTKKPAVHHELFAADIIDPCLRDQRDAMAIPFFSLQKSKRVKPIHYQHNGVEVTVRGLADIGIATIWDADFLIWVASELNEAVRRGRNPGKRLWVIPYHFLLTTRRINADSKGYGAYRRFKEALRRLKGTVIETNIKADGKVIEGGFSWIDYWYAHEDEKGRITGLEVELSEWFFRRVVKDRAILSIHPDYFLLTGGIERWLYRIARKHCGGNRNGWSFTVARLYQQYPPGRPYRKFKADLHSVVGNDSIPEYHTRWETVGHGRTAVDWIHFSLREGALITRQLPCSLRLVDNS
jgi:plasmid replication initiation protein